MKDRSSTFLVTINSNKAITPDSNEGKKFIGACKYLLKRIKSGTFVEYNDKAGAKMFNEEQHEEFKEESMSQYITSAECKMAVEVGETYRKLHVHAPLTINHTSCIKINRHKVADFMARVMGTNVHVDLKATGKAFDKMLSYATKSSGESITV